MAIDPSGAWGSHKSDGLHENKRYTYTLNPKLPSGGREAVGLFHLVWLSLPLRVLKYSNTGALCPKHII